MDGEFEKVDELELNQIYQSFESEVCLMASILISVKLYYLYIIKVIASL